MILGTVYTDDRGDEWKLAGYEVQGRKDLPTWYRYVRVRDGARVRIPSTKFYACQLSKPNAAEWFDVPTGTDQRAEGGGSATIESDRHRVGLD